MKLEVKPQQIIKLVEKLPDSDQHIYIHNGKHCITQEWLVGGNTIEELKWTLMKMLESLDKYIIDET
jgi:hypothetical protein